MFYSQTCENIKLIIFTLDGGLLDLNRLRYNYYRSTCETYHKVATREDFSKMLGNMNTMYDHSLLSDYISAKDFNSVRSPQPLLYCYNRFGLFPFRSPLLRKSMFLSLPPPT